MFSRQLMGLGSRSAGAPGEIGRLLGVCLGATDGTMMLTIMGSGPDASPVRTINLPAIEFATPDGQFNPDLVAPPVVDFLRELNSLQWQTLIAGPCPFAGAIRDLAGLLSVPARSFPEYQTKVRLMAALVEKLAAGLDKLVEEKGVRPSNLGAVRRLIPAAREALCKAQALTSDDFPCAATYVLRVHGEQMDVEAFVEEARVRLDAMRQQIGPLRRTRLDLRGESDRIAILGKPDVEDVNLPYPEFSNDPSAEAVSAALALVIQRLRNHPQYAGVCGRLTALTKSLVGSVSAANPAAELFGEAAPVVISAAQFQRQDLGERIGGVLRELKEDLAEEEWPAEFVMLEDHIDQLEKAIAETDGWMPTEHEPGGKNLTLRITGPTAKVNDALERAAGIIRELRRANLPDAANRYGWKQIGEGDYVAYIPPGIEHDESRPATTDIQMQAAAGTEAETGATAATAG